MLSPHKTIVYRRRLIARACVGALAFAAMMAIALPAHAAVYDPLNVISYETWRDSSSMTATQIQTFLNGLAGPLKTYECTDTVTGTTPVKRTAASIISRSAQASHLNPKVILATLQKEESLLTTSNSSDASRLNKAMGCGVYDSNHDGKVENLYPGFANQVYNGAKKLATYEVTYNWLPGKTKSVTVSSTGKSSTIVPANACTFALYTYTPYYPQKLFWDMYVRYFGDPLAGSMARVSLSALATSYTSVKLSWPGVSGATRYEIWRSTSSSGTYASIATTAGTSYSNTGLTAGTTYYYTVRALKTSGGSTVDGPCSDVQHAVPLPAKVSLSAACAGYTSVKLSWPGVSGATGYQIQRSTSSGGTYSTIATTTALGSTDTSLTTGTTYYYKVRAYRLQGSADVYGGYSDVKSARPVPATPSLTAASAGYTSVQLNWASASGATGYETWRATSSSGTYTKAVTTAGLSYKNTGLTTGRTYYFKTRAYHLQGSTKVYGSYSAIQHARPIPGTVTGVSVVSASSSSINVMWSAVSGTTRYEIYRATSATGTYAKLTTVSGTNCKNTGLTTGATYYYKARAYHLQGSTKVYGAFSVVTSGVPVPAKVALSAASAGYTTVKLSWPGVSGASAYEIWRSTSSGGTYAMVATATATATGRMDTSLMTGATYYYKVRAYHLQGSTKVYGAFSVVTSATPVPATPSLTAVSAGYASAKLSWATVPGATAYEVWRSATSAGAYTRIATATATGSTDTSLTTGTTYYYKVRAVRLQGSADVYGGYSGVKSARPVPATPSMSAASAGYTSAKLIWAAVPGATMYEVWRSTTSAGTYAQVASTTGTGCVNAGLVTGRTYYFKVRAYHLQGSTKVYGAFSAIQHAKPVPGTVSGLTAAKVSSSSISVMWSAVSGATRYEIYRATSATGTYAKLTTVSGTSYKNTGLTAGRTYYFKVRAYHLQGTTSVYGTFSVVASATL